MTSQKDPREMTDEELVEAAAETGIWDDIDDLRRALKLPVRDAPRDEGGESP